MDIPDEILEESDEANGTLLPEKSRSRYENELRAFNEWRTKNAVNNDLNETVMFAYVKSLSKKCKPSSLWTKFSMLKKAFIVNGNVNISRFEKVMTFMKKQNVNYVANKSKVLSVEECRKFILEASDDFLLCKVVIVFGLYGACRRDELLKLTVDDIEDHEKYVLVKLQDTRSFIIPDAHESLNPYDIYQKYAKLRPRHVETRRFFLGYQHGKCTIQPAGMHTIGGVPRKVAEFLGLDQPHNYTGHCLRRSGANMVADSSGWKSSKGVEGCNKSLESKSNEVAAATSSTEETDWNEESNESYHLSVVDASIADTVKTEICETFKPPPLTDEPSYSPQQPFGAQQPSSSNQPRKRKPVSFHQTVRSRTDALKCRRVVHEKEKDACDLFTELLAKKLREFDEVDRLVVMNNIDNLVFRMKMKTLQAETPPSDYQEPFAFSVDHASSSPVSEVEEKYAPPANGRSVVCDDLLNL